VTDHPQNNLSPYEQQQLADTTPRPLSPWSLQYRSNRWAVYTTLLMLGGLFLIGLLGSSQRPKPTASQSVSDTQRVSKPITASEPSEVTDSSPVWAKLASIQSSSPRPPADLRDRFERAFARLNARCPDSAERIGDYLVAGHRFLRDKGKVTSLLELTESVGIMLDAAASNAGIPKTESCAEPVALMVTTLQAR
jgi:hypothetical protein